MASPGGWVLAARASASVQAKPRVAPNSSRHLLHRAIIAGSRLRLPKSEDSGKEASLLLRERCRDHGVQPAFWPASGGVLQ